jgi:phosphoribosylformylglycinamidine cyclo-ligase
MARTFNCGIGMVVIVAPDEAGRIEGILTDAGETPFRIGRIVPSTDRPTTILLNAEAEWPG